MPSIRGIRAIAVPAAIGRMILMRENTKQKE